MNEMPIKSYDVIVVGAGAGGIIASIVAARNGNRVFLIEKLSNIASKIKATGGGRCNLTNTLSNDEFIARFNRNGKFMRDALNIFNHRDLIEFFDSIGVPTHAPDGYRVFPVSHSSKSVIDGLRNELNSTGVEILTSTRVANLIINQNKIIGVSSDTGDFYAPKVIIATGGLGYPVLGADGDGYTMAEGCGHKIVNTHPAMMPLRTKEPWVANCTADTIPKVEMRIDIAKVKNIRYIGDLIFTRHGIRGPVVLDMAREITPFLDTYGEVPVLVNLTKGMNEEQIRVKLNANSSSTILEALSILLPNSVAVEFCSILEIKTDTLYSKLAGVMRDKLIKLLSWTPLTIIGHDGYKMAMITRGGISLKGIDPRTMQSKIIDGLYFCGEVVDIDGPCGGYNLQWSFSSGYLAGQLT